MPHAHEVAVPNPTTPFTSLNESLEALVTCLRLAVPLRLWMVTRVSGDDWSVLFADDNENKVERGTVLRWSDSFCSRMVEEDGPRFAPDAQAVALYREAPINQELEIGAYIGQPLFSEDNMFLGTLCAVDPHPREAFTSEQKQIVELITRTMSTLLSVWMKNEDARHTERMLRHQAYTDVLSGLANRQAWEAVLADENETLYTLGENALVILADLDDLKAVNDRLGHAEGDRYIVKAAHVLRNQVREKDIVARIGGDEFAIFMRGVDKDYGRLMHARIQSALQEANVQASIGFASYLPHGDLKEALRIADMRMYEEKAGRKMLKAESQLKYNG